MIRIEFPPPAFRTRGKEGAEMIFDSLRKKWVRLTPEEWVRQNFVSYLVSVLNYPASLMALEKQIRLGELNKRFDILVYDRQHNPWMIVECKSVDVVLSPEVLNQALRYNLAIPVSYLIITNGSYCMAYKKVRGELQALDRMPDYFN